MPKTNAERQQSARTAIDAGYPGQFDAEPAQAIKDAVTDLLHLAAGRGLDVSVVLSTAEANYDAENLSEARRTAEEVAVEILKGAGLEADLHHTGGGIFCARVDRPNGDGAVGVFQGEDTASPFVVVWLDNGGDELPGISCGPDTLVEVVRAKL